MQQTEVRRLAAKKTNVCGNQIRDRGADRAIASLGHDVDGRRRFERQNLRFHAGIEFAVHIQNPGLRVAVASGRAQENLFTNQVAHAVPFRRLQGVHKRDFLGPG